MMKSICDVSPHVKTRLPGIRTGITVIQKKNRSSNAREQTSFKDFWGGKHPREQADISTTCLKDQNHVTDK